MVPSYLYGNGHPAAPVLRTAEKKARALLNKRIVLKKTGRQAGRGRIEIGPNSPRCQGRVCGVGWSAQGVFQASQVDTTADFPVLNSAFNAFIAPTAVGSM
mmetsp:Transcript_39510/g.79786  ORF Transcript_39510/g.79786 Transcript_39510/m.79786 type:complete len:101 (+) Transcript_39510:17-319(+)